MKKQNTKQNPYRLLLLVLILLLACPFGVFTSGMPVHAAKASQGWVKRQGKQYYYKKGLPVTGVAKIEGKYYYFNPYGVLQEKETKADGKRYLVGKDAVLEAIRYKGNYYYATGKPMTDADAQDYTTLVRAREVAAKITNSKMSESQKLLACFRYTMHFPYKMQRKFYPTDDWPAVNANDHFVRGAGDCHADACSFAYLCAALGMKNIYVCNDATGTRGEGHSWAEVDGRVYDPLFAEAKSFANYYGVSYGSYYGHAILHVPVPYYSPSHAAKTAKAITSSKDGLQKKDGSYYFFKNGKAVKNRWLRIAGNKYYFSEDGKALAGGARQVKQSYYVFGKKGVLFEPKKISEVKVSGHRYLVRPNGKAYHGWSDGKTCCYSETGERLKGIHVLHGKFFVFSSKGVYAPAKSKKINQAAVPGKPAEKLLSLLGHPKSQSVSPNCDIGEGEDGLYDYGNFAIRTYIPPEDDEEDPIEIYQGLA